MGYLPYLPVAKHYEICKSEARSALNAEDRIKHDKRVKQCNIRCNPALLPASETVPHVVRQPRWHETSEADIRHPIRFGIKSPLQAGDL